MNAKERIMAALHHEEPDVIPFTVILSLQLYGFSEANRKLMNIGLGLEDELSVQAHKVISPHVKMEVTHEYGNVTSWSRMDLYTILNKPHLVRTTYTTPVGSISTTARWGGFAPWFTEGGYMINDLPDYEVIKFMVEDTEYSPNYEDILAAQRAIGNDGVVAAFTPKSPLQEMILMMGYRRFSLDYYMRRKEFDELYRLLYKRELEIYKIAAESPAEIVWSGDNMNGVVTTPEMFEKYCIPFYNEAANILHKHDKIYSVHMDGKLASLRDLISKASIDVIEGFTPPPVGDLPLKEAREAWKEKIIWANFPETVSLYGQEAVEKKTIEILKSVAPGDNFLLGIMEDFPSPIHFLESVTTILKTVMKHGVYPIQMHGFEKVNGNANFT